MIVNNPPHEPQHAADIATIDADLETIDRLRRELKERGRSLMALKANYMMIDQLTLRILNDSTPSANELAWIKANPDEWEAIKQHTHGQRGTRTPMHALCK